MRRCWPRCGPIARAHLRMPAQLSAPAPRRWSGRRAIVLERIANDEGVGCVKLDGEVWTARAYDEDDVIEAGHAACRSSRSGAPRRS